MDRIRSDMGRLCGIGAIWVIQKKELTSSEDSLISTLMRYSYIGGSLVVDTDMKVKI